ncbi:YbjQ family protein [Geothermobacter hydrogeniphilus]|uniref:YbjQ family protein n=1 Tax=Geothermobacter hydrogeniphilus TaxID=1969733 RepID=UPI001557C7D5|nr:heavy metal-binding domain-containing protein [Geothermobacter hydrogeniphilus]
MVEFFLQSPDLVIFLVLLALGYAAGSLAEKRHYKSIEKRERELVRLAVVTAEGSFPPGRVRQAFLVSGSTVVSIDYFKRLLAILRNIFGGRVKAYESLVDRARREAILRMKAEAQQRGAGMILNLRLETATIGRNANRKNQVGSVEAIAYGTAIVFNK